MLTCIELSVEGGLAENPAELGSDELGIYDELGL